jgi:hypothetical protein
MPPAVALAAQSGEVGAASEILVAKAEQVFPGQSSAWLLPLHACRSRQLPGSLMAASVGEQKRADHGRGLPGFVRGASQTTDRAGRLA